MVKCSCGADMIETISDINMYIDTHQKDKISTTLVGVLKNIPVLTCSECKLDVLAVDLTLDTDGIHLKSKGE